MPARRIAIKKAAGSRKAAVVPPVEEERDEEEREDHPSQRANEGHHDRPRDDRPPPRDNWKECSHCKWRNHPSSKHCGGCGVDLQSDKLPRPSAGVLTALGNQVRQPPPVASVQPLVKPAAPTTKPCPNGHENPSTAKFCRKCGTALCNGGAGAQQPPAKSATKKCPDGHENPQAARFCRQCGTEFQPDA